MKNIIVIVKQNKIKLVLLISLIVLLVLGVIIYNYYKDKEYIVEEILEHKYYQLNDENKMGVIDTKGNIIIEPKYDNIKIPNPQKAIFICEIQNIKEVLNEKAEKIFTQYEEIEAIPIKGIVSNMPYEKSVLKYKKAEKYGLINLEGKIITKAIYEQIEGLTNKESELLVKKNGKYGVINAKGAQIINEEYDGILGDGFYTDTDKYKLSGYIVNVKTQNGYRYGYINSKLQKILKSEYNEINRITETEDITNTFLIVSKNGKMGVVKNDKVIINYGYQNIEYDAENKLFVLERNSKFGVSNIIGKQIIQTEYDEISFNGEYIKGIKGQDEVFFDVLGNKIQDKSYTSILKTDNENYLLSIDNKGLYGILSNNNEILIDNKYKYIEYLFNDYFIASKDTENLGVINSKNEIIVDFKYDVLQKIGNSNLIEAKILKENKSELYSKDMKKIYNITNPVISVLDDYIKVYSDQDIKYFDLDGKEILNTDIFIKNKLFSKKQENKWGYTNKEGKVIINFKYNKVTEFNEYGFAGINIDNKWGVIDDTGKVLVEPIYNISSENSEPEFIGEYYKVYYGYGESYYTDKIK